MRDPASDRDRDPMDRVLGFLAIYRVYWVSARVSCALPAGIVTQLRDPLDRVLSVYEFAVDNAIGDVDLKNNSPPEAINISMSDTDAIWPWSVLGPLLQEDHIQRVILNLTEVSVFRHCDWVEG